MPTPISPTQSGLPLIDPAKQKVGGPQNLSGNPIQGRPGDTRLAEEKVSLSINGQPAAGADPGVENNKIARKLIQLSLDGIQAADQVLSGVQEMWKEGQPSSEQLQPAAMKIIETAGRSYQGVSPLDSERAIVIGKDQKIPAFKLIGDSGSALIEFSSLLSQPQGEQSLQVARENLEWARGELGKASIALDQQILLHSQQALQQRGIQERPPVPEQLSASLHTGLTPSRIADLIS